MSARTILLATALGVTVGAPRASYAQRRAEDEDRVHMAIAAGGDVRRDSSFRVGSLIATWRPHASALGVRLDATYGQRPVERQQFVPPLSPCLPDHPCPGPIQYATTTRTVGATLGPTFELVRSGPLRPYLFGGAGVFATRTSVRRKQTYNCPVEMLCAGGASDVTTSGESWWRATLHAGAGAELRLGPVGLLAEARWLLADDPHARGVQGIVPMLVGIRF